MTAHEQKQPLVFRIATPADQRALERLAALDSAEPLEDEVLLAELGSELRAAVSLETGHAVADPFHSTADVVAFLRVRAEQLRPSDHPRRGHRRRRRVRAGTLRAALRTAA